MAYPQVVAETIVTAENVLGPEGKLRSIALVLTNVVRRLSEDEYLTDTGERVFGMKVLTQEPEEG